MIRSARRPRVTSDKQELQSFWQAQHTCRRIASLSKAGKVSSSERLRVRRAQRSYQVTFERWYQYNFKRPATGGQA